MSRYFPKPQPGLGRLWVAVAVLLVLGLLVLDAFTVQVLGDTVRDQICAAADCS